MSLDEKLHLQKGQRIRIVNEPDDVNLGPRSETRMPSAEAVLLFVRDRTDLLTEEDHAIMPAQRGKPAWIAYPKQGLETNLDREVIAGRLRQNGVRDTEEVPIDDVWSALRVEPLDDEA